MTLRYTLFLALSALVLATLSCARIISPTGGPEDDIPPNLISSTPNAGETNYSGSTIVLAFDERIQTRSIETDLIITPKPNGSFKTRVNKNEVILTFFEPFQENTTYSLSFANTIQDVTNGNAATGLSLSFSTGPYIDSLTIAGRVLNLYTQEPVENTLVSLYTAKDSLDILKGAADYYSKTDSAGRYTFSNLPSGDFRVYAVRDKNNNSKADSDAEKYGFYPDTLNLIASMSNIDMTLQNLNTTPLRTLSGRTFGSYYELTFNKAITEFELLSGDKLVYHPIEDTKIRFYRNGRNYNDTTQLIYQVTDSLNVILTDTSDFYFAESKLKPTVFSTSISPLSDAILGKDTIRFTFNKPILSLNMDSIFYRLDSTNIVSLDQSNFIWNKYKTQLSVPIKLETLLNGTYEGLTLDLKAATFISVDQDSSKSQQKTLSILKPENSAVIGGSIITNQDNIIVQLLDNRSLKVIRQTTSKKFLFEYLPAGQYQVRVIKDLNSNGKWDIGNIFNNMIPEPAKFYYDSFYNTKTIEVRKNWEQTDVNINF